MIINRAKCMFGYPESRPEMIYPSSIIYRLDQWGAGKKRSLSKYMEMVGIDTKTKKVTLNSWCNKGEWPEQAKPYMLTSKQKKDLVAAEKRKRGSSIWHI